MTQFKANWFLDEGFVEAPTYVEAHGGEMLYRVFDTADAAARAGSKITGKFYSFTNPLTVTEADRHLNIVKWGNRCLYVATFRATEGTPMFVGRIDQCFARKDPGEVGSQRGAGAREIAFGGNPNAKQVWIEPDRALIYLTLVGTPRRLIQDKVVVASPARDQ